MSKTDVVQCDGKFRFWGTRGDSHTARAAAQGGDSEQQLGGRRVADGTGSARWGPAAGRTADCGSCRWPGEVDQRDEAGIAAVCVRPDVSVGLRPMINSVDCGVVKPLSANKCYFTRL